MKKSFFIVLICVGLLLTCCNSSNQDTDSLDGFQTSPQETESVEIKDYPDLIDTEEGKLLTPLLPDEVFDSSAEENGLDGTLYQVYGTVTEYIYDENSEIEAFRVHTHKGNIVIGDLCQSLISDGTYDELGTIDVETIRQFMPIPPKDELLCIFAEYQGMSNVYDCPYFIYGSSDYLAEALLASLILPEEMPPVETQESSPSSADPAPTEETKPVTQYGAGMYKVGTDLPAGEYLFFADDRDSAYICVSTDSNQDDIIENEIFDYTFFMTVADGQYLQAKRCVFIEASSTTVEINADGSLPEGMYRVGIDIPAGEYRLTADDGDSGYWCTYNSTIIPLDVEDNDIFDGSTYVTVTDGQYLIINRCTAKLAE